MASKTFVSKGRQVAFEAPGDLVTHGTEFDAGNYISSN
jgi:hypothetical protein